MRQLLDEQEIAIKDLAGTTLDRIGNVIADGIAAGEGPWSVRNRVNEYLDDPARSFVIANTEGARAMIASQSDQYQAQGFATFDWIAHDGCCDECGDMEDNNPHDYSDDTPPLHPNCRCGMVGSGDVSGEETDGEDVPLDEMPAEETPEYEAPSDVPEPEIHDTTSTILDPTQIISDVVATTSETPPITFETIADARSWFEGNQIEFDEVGLKKIGMNPSILETVATAIQDANIKSPGIIDELEFIGKKVGRAKNGELASVGAKVEGPYKLSKSRLYFPQSFVNFAKMDNVDVWLTTTDQVTANSISDIITHEMGHVIQNMTRDNSIGWKAADTAMQSAITDAMKIAGVNPNSPVGRKWIAKNISTYANDSRYELHSEVQVLFKDQTRFDKLPEEVRTFLLAYQEALNTTYGPNFVKTLNKATEDQTKERVIVDTFGFTDKMLRDLGILN